MVVAKFTRDTFNQAWSTARLTRATPSSVRSLQPILSLPQKNFTPSRLVVIAAVFVSRIMKGRPTTGPVWALKKKYTYIRFMFRFRWNIKRCLRKKLKCSWVFFSNAVFCLALTKGGDGAGCHLRGNTPAYEVVVLVTWVYSSIIVHQFSVIRDKKELVWNNKNP